MSALDPKRDTDVDRLITRYSRLIRSAVVRVAGPLASELADDIEQRVAIALWRAMPGEQTPSHPASYLYRAAVRETVRAVKALRKANETALDDVHRDPAPSPERVAEARELGEAIRQALSALAPDRRTAVRAHLAGFGAQEIMSMNGWPYNKTRNLVARGMADLRRELSRRGVRG